MHWTEGRKHPGQASQSITNLTVINQQSQSHLTSRLLYGRFKSAVHFNHECLDSGRTLMQPTCKLCTGEFPGADKARVSPAGSEVSVLTSELHAQNNGPCMVYFQTPTGPLHVERVNTSFYKTINTKISSTQMRHNDVLK